MLRFCLPVKSSQKCTICRAQSISSFSYSFAQVSSSSQRVSCVETKASCSRKSEKQHNKQGWPSKPTALLPRAPERAAQKHPSIEITSGSLLLSLGLCIRGIHFIPWEMKGRAGQGAKKLRLCLVGLSEEAEQLFTFVWGKLERQQASESSMPAQRTMQHLAEIQHFLAAVTGGWRAVFALSTSPHLRLVWSPGCKADFVPPLSCK